MILHTLKTVSGEEIEISEGLEAFLDAVNIYDLEANTDDRTDLSVAFWHPEAPLTGFSVRCRLAPMNPLLDGGRDCQPEIGTKWHQVRCTYSQ